MDKDLGKFGENSGEIRGKLGGKNKAILKKIENAPFTIREKKGSFYARAFFTFEDRQLQKEFAMGDSLELTALLALWQDIEKVKAGELPIDSLDKWGKQKKKRSLPPKELIDKDSISIGEAIASFKDVFSNRRSPESFKAKTTWKSYQKVIGKIPQAFWDKTVSIENLTKLITDNSPPETRKREKWVLTCKILAKFADIDDITAIKNLKGDRQTQLRYIPSDDRMDFSRFNEGILNNSPDSF